MIDLPFPPYFEINKFREGVDHGKAYSMKASGDLVATIVKFASSVEFGHHHFHRRTFLLFMDIDRDAAAVISDGDAVIDMNDDVDLGTISPEGFINAVVDQFMNQMVKAFDPGVPNIHGRPFADGCQTLQDLYLFRHIFLCLLLHPFSSNK
jgi:hypothetical protein